MIEFNASQNQPTYFVADIAANHDGSLERAIRLIELAALSGANAAKFQHFRAETIVSNRGFRELKSNRSHQASWDKPVIDVYREASIPLDWTDDLIKACEKYGIEFFTAPYDLEYVDLFASKMRYFKVGSGDITWHESLRKIAAKGLPVLLATGASEMSEVRAAVSVLQDFSIPLVLMQCNTNYTGSPANAQYLNLNVLNSFKREFPNVVLGLSDHTEGHLSVVAAVTLGARVIEKHFTDDSSRLGPDHAFSLDPASWKLMVDEVRDLELMLGDGIKRVEANEIDARIVQRRGLRFNKPMKANHVIQAKDILPLRPCPPNALPPTEAEKIIGKTLKVDVDADELVQYSQLL